jgi:hypothetical protein
MKTPEQALEETRRRLRNTWHLDATGQGTAWPHQIPLGSPSKTTLESDFARYQQAAFGWRDWAAAHQLTITDTNRTVHGTTQRIPAHLTIPTADAAARLCGAEWVRRLKRGRVRASQLSSRYPHVQDIARMIRGVDSYTDTDFELLCAAADWFSRHSGAGLTPRQVPVPGLHAKWLNTRQPAVAALAGIPGLGLLPPHPARLHLTYLDPGYLATGRRRHDSATVGDTMTPAYQPEVVVISENKDTALHFPPLPAGVSVEGVGYGGGTAAAFPWLKDCPNLFYWGDIDSAGFEILDGFREAGLAVTSMLMDAATYEQYERFGTRTDARGNEITAGTRRLLLRLTEAERQLYEHLTDPSWTRFRRVEQEKIPLDVASRAIGELMKPRT